MDYHTSFSNNCGSCARRSTDRGTELCFLIDAILLRALFMGLTLQLFAADSLERHRRTFCPRTIDGLGRIFFSLTKDLHGCRQSGSWELRPQPARDSRDSRSVAAPSATSLCCVNQFHHLL